VKIEYVTLGQALRGKEMAGLVDAIIQFAKSQRLSKRILGSVFACISGSLVIEQQEFPVAEFFCPVSE